ncbi:MAG TPA: GAF domain-containing sensor histidine kinase [Actinomycetota bacterium]|nr:GAF domain-containing sensor histidine kinase [Actinomycetota bacterium]
MNVVTTAPPPSGLAAEVSRAVAEADDLQTLTRPLLELLNRVTGLESTYLTRIRWDDEIQDILMARNSGSLEVTEGLEVPWEDAVCRRALRDRDYFAANVQERWPDSPAGHDLRIRTYITEPIVVGEEEVFGTLCAASDHTTEVSAEAREVLRLFARLIADQIARERLMLQERNRAEAAEQLLQSRARFLAAAEHALKNPLAVILGWSELLHTKSDRLSEDDRREGVAMIRERAAALRQHLDRMLEDARSEIVARELEIGAIELGPLATELAREFGGVSEDHPIEVISEPTAVARADRAALRTVLEHLLENAIKYSPKGGEIRVETTRESDGVLMRVIDQGVGVPDDVDVFAPFERGDTGTQGVGLGLHIVRNLVDAMHGSVSAERNAGSPGSTFTVKLPAAL